MVVIALVAALVAVAVPAPGLRYERPLQTHGPAPATVVPDGPMFAHARSDFGDVRIADAHGEQVPWRPLPLAPATVERRVTLLDQGHRGRFAVARIDLGRSHGIVSRVTLDVPDDGFTGGVTVLGSDDRRRWTELSTTQIFSVQGAAPARSTTALLPRSDFRYFELRATGVTRIDGATVAGRSREPALRALPARVRVYPSVVTVDLGHRNVPVDSLVITTTSKRYARPFTVIAGAQVVAAGDLVGGSTPRPTVVYLTARTRVLRILIGNGDNPPLRGLRVTALARPRTLLVEGGHAGPLTLYYGGPLRAPVYDFARLPRSALGLGRATPATLGPERANLGYRIVDTRSFVARHRSLVTLALVLAAAAVIGATALTLRRA
jgi:hypothetical protein